MPIPTDRFNAPYVKAMMRSKPPLDEPKSWAELLKRREAERVSSFGLEYYRRDALFRPTPAGVIPLPAPETSAPPDIIPDTHLYATTHIFDPLEPEPLRIPKIPPRQPTPDLVTWRDLPKQQREDEVNAILAKQRARGFPRALQDSDARYDLISGAPSQTPFQSRIDQILRDREHAFLIDSRRKPDPLANRFPTAELDEAAGADEKARKQREFEYWQSKLSANERRAKNTFVNLITGELKDANAAKSITEFCGRSTKRSEVALEREKDIVAKRDEHARVAQTRIGYRYNNGRMLELRDWDIVNGRGLQPGWDESVVMKPGAWECCTTEALPTAEA
jgi:hypothetical protein